MLMAIVGVALRLANGGLEGPSVRGEGNDESDATEWSKPINIMKYVCFCPKFTRIFFSEIRTDSKGGILYIVRGPEIEY